MSPTKLETLLSWVVPLIAKKETKMTEPSESERLCVTMRYLVTDDAQVTSSSSIQFVKIHLFTSHLEKYN